MLIQRVRLLQVRAPYTKRLISTRIAMAPHSRDEVITTFKDCVNMAPEELQEWLNTSESHSVGMVREGQTESQGHQSGRRIVDLLQKNEEQFTEEDLEHMSKVNAYVKRHSAQRPHKSDNELEHSRWCYSLRNWGHDPLRVEEPSYRD